jgi:acetyl-CoA synthetase
VILRENVEDSGDEVVQTLRNHVGKDIGPIAKPRQIMVVQELPKTRSGKIMRRLLRDIAEDRELGDVTTLTDSSVMNIIKDKLPAAPAED